MGLILTTTAGLVVWIVLWAIGVKSFDAFLLTLGMIILAATVRMILPSLPGSRPDPTSPPKRRSLRTPWYARIACAPACALESRRKSEYPL